MKKLGNALVLALFAVASSSAAAAEPWADSRLSIQEGLVTWLDGSTQNAARKARNEPELADGENLAIWYDGSGHQRHVRRNDPVSQPALRLVASHGFVRFDGLADSLSIDGAGAKFDDLTIFIVAAPHGSEGGFPALLAMNAAGEQDYTSGLTIDLGPFAAGAFDALNVEGNGFGGARDLKNTADPFSRFARICATSKVGPQGVSLYVNGRQEGSRERTQSTIAMDQLLVGARYYGVPLGVRGYIAGEIAEVLIFDRVLTDGQRGEVDQYLEAKYRDVEPIPPRSLVAGAKPLNYVLDPPPVQMFVPGFAVRELLLELPNINNVLYRDDGKLVALAYNGNVYVLSDNDGDGLEDKASLYWENKGQIRSAIGMDLTPAGYERGRGVFITSKMKCLLVVDSDGDDVADKEITVAEGWQETFHGVDALGMAIDPRDGSVYFGIGTQNFADAYVAGEDGKAKFRIEGERGTIQRVSPDFKSRETIATGIRFPVAIRFNRDGDLFCTDQEGATWLPNGNPFDELLLIDRERKRHYGFPPRHPRHLPGVIDEPSLFDYGPQHQSTCGLNFNEPLNGGPVFGPKWWQGDAIVTGYSRGKLYRTALAKTSTGYVASNQLIASLKFLTADACVSPDGALVVATHSGGPDWGSGPSGAGKLLKVAYADRDAPIPVLAWARTPHEVRVAFDRPLAASDVEKLASNIAIERGQFVAAGDRFEQLRPGYAAVARQVNLPRFELKVLGAALSPDRRTLMVATAPHRAAISYAITLPGIGRNQPNAGELPQSPEIDLAYDLTGVETTWQPATVELPWHGWLPHLDLAAARRFTAASADHDDFWNRIKQAGTLTLRAQLRLNQMLRPEVQPGSQIDFEYPFEKTTVVLETNCRLEVTLDGAAIDATQHGDYWRAEFTRPSSEGDAIYQLQVRLRHEANQPAPSLAVSYHTNEDAAPRALPLRRIIVPWAEIADEPHVIVNNRDLPELEGGNWLRGKAVFFSEKALCSKCHLVRGEGGLIGPDLSNLPQRDYASVLRDITRPSYAINPDFVSYMVVTNGGRALAGSIRSHGDELIIGHQDGKETRIARDEVDALHPDTVSIMPEKIAETLGADALRDLLTFLLTEPPSMPNYGPLLPPSQRTLDEVQAVLAGAPESLSTRPLRVALVAGRKDHGPGEHDYPAWKVSWQQLLSMAEDTQVTTADDWPSTGELKSADVLVFYQQGTWTPQRARDIDRFLARGGGAVYIHYAVDGGQDAPGFAQRIGLAWRGGASKFRHGPLDVDFSPAGDHPIARNFQHVHFHDESYWNLLGDTQKINLLASGVEDGSPQPLFWTATSGKGRVFVSIPGHFAWTFDDPLFRTLLLRGIAWSAGEPVDRFNALVTPGARIQTGR
ncbi:MAG TPA: ThuA domain-containing protein [Lacipirellulaceae bacterium]|nr:ThuA domain-containing protein [Lacipirellulaceae bacterium]